MPTVLGTIQLLNRCYMSILVEQILACFPAVCEELNALIVYIFLINHLKNTIGKEALKRDSPGCSRRPPSYIQHISNCGLRDTKETQINIRKGFNQVLKSFCKLNSKAAEPA